MKRLKTEKIMLWLIIGMMVIATFYLMTEATLLQSIGFYYGLIVLFFLVIMLIESLYEIIKGIRTIIIQRKNRKEERK